MAFIGNTNTTQAFTPAIDYFSGNASTTAFTLSRPVASVAQVQVTIDNVAQNPSSAFTVSANTITFTSAPLSGTNNIYVYYTSPITQVIAPGQSTVGLTALSATGTPSASTYLRGDNSWAAVSVSPGGSTTQVQYNNAGAFGGISGVTTDGIRMTASTTIGVGGATPSTSGSGITFPATQSDSSNANTLDDYEEGTWTPNVGTLVNMTGTPTYTNAKYQKIGNRCFFMACVNGLSVTTSNIRTEFRVDYPFSVDAFAVLGFAYSNNASPFGGMLATNVAYSQIVFIQGITPPTGAQTFQVGGSIYTA